MTDHDWVIASATGLYDFYRCGECGAEGGPVDGHSFDPYFDGEPSFVSKSLDIRAYTILNSEVLYLSQDCDVAKSEILYLEGP